ncbi:MAG: methionyl-tRNA formyltransferase [Burkholderiales bacterium]
MAGLAVGFAGTPVFAATALEAIAQAGYTITVVLTRPDRPKGRGLKLEASPVKELATRLGAPVLQPPSLKTEGDRAMLAGFAPDVLVVAAYGLLLPRAVLDWPRRGCLNIHASLLPRWRGAAPIPRAIEAGDSRTGISIMRMEEGLDTGPVVDSVATPILGDDTAATLTDRLAALGAEAIVRALRRLDRDGRLEAVPQSSVGATYAAKISRDDAAIDWTLDATTLDRRVRAYEPAPGAHAVFGDTEVKIRAARPIVRAASALAGEVVASGAAGIDVACGAQPEDGALRVVELQPAGGRRMTAAAYAAGRGIRPGARFGPGRRG